MTGMAFRAHSGEPTNYLGSHPIYGNDTAYILPRGSGDRTPWVFAADLNLGYRFNIDKDKSIAATVDIFNLFNFQAESARDQRYTTADTLPIPGGTKAQLPVKNADGSYTCTPPSCALRNSDGTTYNTDPAMGGIIPNPNFGHPIDYQPPRQFRFGLRMTF
jgi:hypothetical protein